jgi:hypothetical protein
VARRELPWCAWLFAGFALGGAVTAVDCSGSTRDALLATYDSGAERLVVPCPAFGTAPDSLANGWGCGYAGGAPMTGSVGPDGGSVSRLYFAVVGDTRPATVDDTLDYPTSIIARIYSDMDALIPKPTFAISTGDYQFSSVAHDEASRQLDLYLAARSRYSGVVFPAMGNHECTGRTASNCGSGNVDGVTNNYLSYLSKLLAPIQKTAPYYEIDVQSIARAWTAKFLFVAANAWTSQQSSWLDSAMSRPTTYTFVVRHEGSEATSAPGVSPSERILATHPYTLSICGHTHSYEHRGREVIIGNGGAPLSSSKNYGFAMISQRDDGALAVDMIDYASGEVDLQFHFVVNPDGTASN